MQVSLILDRSSSAGVFPANGAPQESTGSGQEMPSLDKDGATFPAERLVQAHVRASDPGPRWVAPMLVFEDARHHKNFLSAIVPVGIEISLGRPFDQCRSTALLHQWHDVQARHHALEPRRRGRVDDLSDNLLRPKMAQLDKQGAPLRTEGRVGRAWRIHEVAARRVVA